MKDIHKMPVWLASFFLFFGPIIWASAVVSEDIFICSVNHQHLNHWCWHLYFYFHSRCLTHNLFLFYLSLLFKVIALFHIFSLTFLGDLWFMSLGLCVNLCFTFTSVKSDGFHQLLFLFITFLQTSDSRLLG